MMACQQTGTMADRDHDGSLSAEAGRSAVFGWQQLWQEVFLQESPWEKPAICMEGRAAE